MTFTDGWSFIKPVDPTGIDGRITHSSVNYVGERYNALDVSWSGVGQGIKRTIPTEVGKQYVYSVTVKDLSNAGTRRLNARARGIATAPFTFSPGNIMTLPTVSFIANSTSTTIELVATDPTALTSGKIAVFDVWVDVLETKLPQRFLTTSFSGSLADHLDLAVNSIGAAWYVDRFGVVQFTPPPEMLPVSHTFSDKRSDGVLEYTGIETVWDTQQTVNHLVIRNRSYGSSVKTEELAETIRRTVKDGDGPKSEEKEAEYEWRDEASIAKYGERTAEVETNVALPDPYTERMRQEHPDWGIPVSPWQDAYDDLKAKLASNRTTPRLLVTSLTWNAQQDTDAARNFELGQRVRVFTRGFEQDAIITGIDHDVTPDRWNMILTLGRP